MSLDRNADCVASQCGNGDRRKGNFGGVRRLRIAKEPGNALATCQLPTSLSGARNASDPKEEMEQV